jgi:N-acetyl sugar amidotransferase
MPRYCQRCVLPDSRPGVKLDAQLVCAGCRNAERKARTDWIARAIVFRDVVAHAKARGARHDCVIPVSGGKDSHWQVVTCLEHGLRPLCLTYVYPGRTRLGEENLATLLRLGVDHRELRLAPQVERRFVERAFRKTGISGLVSHMAIYAWPLRVALEEGVPLVVYGENSAFEYGTADDALLGQTVDARWRRAFGVTAGTTAEDWLDGEITRDAIAPLFAPSDEDLARGGVRALFLGYYHRWDPEHSYRVALAHGFRARAEGARVGHANYVNIDDDMLGVHHHLKWHKFGITRSWDTLSMEIRSGRMTRLEAVAALRRRGDETPWDDIVVFCRYLGIAREEYFRIVEGFRNREIWSRREGRWVIDGFLIDDFPWPADVVEPP